MSAADVPWAARFQAAFERSPVAMALSGLADGRVLDVNEAFGALTGHARAEIVGRPFSDLGIWSAAEDQGRVMARLLAGGEIRALDVTLRRAAGEVASLALSATTLLLDERTAVLWCFADVGADRRQARLEALLAASRELVRIQPMPALLARLAEACTRLLGTDGVDFRLVEGDELVVAAAAGDQAQLAPPARLRIGYGLNGRVAASGQPVVVAHGLPDDPRVAEGAREGHRRLGHQGWLGVPIKAADQVVGTLATWTRRTFGPDDVALATAFATQVATALRNATLYENAERRRAEAESLAALARSVAALDPRRVLDTVVERTCALLGTQRAAVALVEPEGRVHFAAVHGVPPDFMRFEPRHPLDGVTATAITERRAAWSGDILGDPSFDLSPESRAFIQTSGQRAVLAAPLLAGPRVVGALFTSREELGPFREDQVRLIEAIAAHAALALENARLFGLESARRRQAEALADIERELVAELDRDRLLHLIVDRAAPLFEAYGGILLRAADGALLMRASTDPTAIGDRLAPGEGVSGQVLASRRGALVNDYDTRLIAVPLALARRVRHILAQPLVARDELLGVIVMTRHGASTPRFRDEDLAVLGRFAALAGLALRNATLYEERHRLYDEVRRARDFLQSITENSADAILATDVDGRISYASPRSAELFGYASPDRILGRSLRDLEAPGMADGHEAGRRPLDVGDAREVRRYETTLRTDDGRPREVSASVAPLREPSGAVAGHVVVLRDVTEQKRTQEALRQSEKLGFMGSLLAGVAHELNNPLAVVLGQGELLQGAAASRSDPELREMAGEIARAADRCARIVRTFLSLARRQAPVRERVEINAVVQEALDSWPIACASTGWPSLEIWTPPCPRSPPIRTSCIRSC